MRRAISVVLALMIVLSLACTAFAAPRSAGSGSGTGGSCTGGKDHNWKDGVCKECGEECDHDEYKNGKCVECGEKCDHEYKNGKCTICGMKKSSSGSNPKTGDMMILPYAAAMVSSAAALAFVYRKEND